MKQLNDLIDVFRSFKGIGPKMAERIAIQWLKMDSHSANKILQILKDAKQIIKFCKECQNISLNDICDICSDKTRNTSQLCIVENPQDLFTIESTNFYKGRYFVLGGPLAPLDGIGPQDIKIDKLIQMLKKNFCDEIIIATNPTIEGEMTASFITKVLKDVISKTIKITRISRGIPTGGSIEYMDEITLKSSFENRKEI